MSNAVNQRYHEYRQGTLRTGMGAAALAEQTDAAAYGVTPRLRTIYGIAASEQCQDITRQQIEQVTSGINRLDTHASSLAGLLERLEVVPREQAISQASEGTFLQLRDGVSTWDVYKGPWQCIKVSRAICCVCAKARKD